MKIDRNDLLYKLQERQYLKNLHNTIKVGLIGTLRNEYIMSRPTKKLEDVNTFLRLPIFSAMVDMMTANLIYFTSEKFVHEICDTLEEKPNA